MEKHMIRSITDLFKNQNRTKQEQEISESDWDRLKKAEQLSAERFDSIIVCRGFGIIN